MTTKPDDRLMVAADMIDTGAILQAYNQLSNLNRLPITCVLLAEVAIQLGRIDEASELLTKSANDMCVLAEVARFARAEGELLLAKQQPEKAAARFEAASYLNELLKSRFGLAWAQYGLGRAAIASGNLVDAEIYLKAAQDGLKLRLDNKGAYLHGLVNLSLALLKRQEGKLDDSEEYYAVAIDQLRKTEKL